MLLNVQINNDIFFDEKYFAYFEDADLCVRLQRSGYKLVYNPNSKIWHKISRSSGLQSEFYNYHFGRNRILFMKKHAHFMYKIIFYPYQVVFKGLVGFLYFGIKYKKIKLANAFLNGIKDGLNYKVN
jgi:GT2 family glycosyltransferase